MLSYFLFLLLLGYDNALSAVNWIQQQQASGALASTLSNFAVMGCSAGSIGAQIWADNSLNMIKWNQVTSHNHHPSSHSLFSYFNLYLSLTHTLSVIIF